METRIRRIFLLFLIGFGLTYHSVAAAYGESLSACWQIDYSTNFAGHIRVIFSDSAISMNLEKFGVTVLSKGPNWNAFVYNNVNKHFMEVSAERFRNSKFIEKLIKRQLEKAAVVHCDFTHKTKTIEGFETSQMVLSAKDSIGKSQESSEVWVTPSLHVPAEFNEFLQIALGVSHRIDGTPLQISVMEKDLDTQTPHLVQALIAYKVTKTSDNAAFKALSGYKEVKTELGLLTADDTK